MGGKKKYIEKIYRDVRFFHGTFQLVPMPRPHSKYPRWQWQTSKRSMTWNEGTDCNFCNHKIMFRKNGHSSNNQWRNVKGKKDITCHVETDSLSPFQRPFSRWIWVGWYQNVSILDFIVANDDGGAGDNWSCKTYKLLVYLSATNEHRAFHSPDAHPVAQPSQQY